MRIFKNTKVDHDPKQVGNQCHKATLLWILPCKVVTSVVWVDTCGGMWLSGQQWIFSPLSDLCHGIPREMGEGGNPLTDTVNYEQTHRHLAYLKYIELLILISLRISLRHYIPLD